MTTGNKSCADSCFNFLESACHCNRQHIFGCFLLTIRSADINTLSNVHPAQNVSTSNFAINSLLGKGNNINNINNFEDDTSIHNP